ncbi:MAG: YcxB family protein, partial [Huintestinicola sp.]
KISTLYDPYISEEAEKEAEAEEKETDQKDNDPDSELPPATIIHLDNAAVEIVESSELFVVYIKKLNVFVIPKSAFKPYEVMEIKNRLSNIMGVRYKSV